MALCLSILSYENHTSHLESIVFGSGCFWGAEKGYEALEGVEDAVTGYAEGYGIKQTYREITKYSNKYNNDLGKHLLSKL